MAVVIERHGTRRSDGRSATREYQITQVTSDDEARSAMLAAAPSTVIIGGIPYTRDNAQSGVDEIHTQSADGTSISSGIWFGGVTWQRPGATGIQPSGSFSLSFDISGQSVRITHSRETVSIWDTPGRIGPDFAGAINAREDGTIEGVDILVPFFSYTLTRTYAASDISGAWVLTAARIVGSVNVSSYHGFEAGELLLTRVSGQQRSDGEWDITFSFAVSFNETDLRVGDITGIVKDGWDYLWVYYEETEDTARSRTNKKPISAFVERVYRRTNYSALGI